MKRTASIPNSMIEKMFFKTYKHIEDVYTYRRLVAKGTSSGIASATAFASRKIDERIDEWQNLEHEMRAVVNDNGGSIFMEEPSLRR